jgi:hypothetical protein
MPRAQLMNGTFDPMSELIDIDDEIDIETVAVTHELPTRLGK